MKKNILFFVLISVLIFFSFSPALEAPFMHDSTTNIEENQQIRSLDNLFYNLFIPQTTKGDLMKYLNDPARPLTFLTFHLNYYFHKLNTVMYRLTNMMFLVLAGFCIFIFFKTILSLFYDKEKSTIAAALGSFFIVLHPLNNHTVSYIYHRSEIITLVFFTLCLYAYFKAIKTDKVLHYLMSVICFILGLLTKQSIMVMPLVILVFDYLFLSDCSFKNLWKNKYKILPYIVITIAYDLYQNTFLQTNTMLIADTSFKAKIAYFLSQPRSIIHYIEQTFVPFKLQLLHYPESVDSLSSVSFVFPFFTLVFLAVMTLYIFIKAKQTKFLRLYAFAVFFYFLNILPTSSFFISNEIMADRRFYISLLGAGMAIAILLLEMLKKDNRKQKLIYGVFAVYIVFLGGLSFIQSHTIADSKKLYNSAIKAYPKAYEPYMNLAIEYAKQNKYDEALALYEKALEIKPLDTYVLSNIAVMMLQQGQNEEALKYIEMSANQEPSEPKWQLMKADIYERLKNLNKAEEIYANGAVNFPEMPIFKFKLAQMLTENQQNRRAADIADFLIAAYPENPDYHTLKAFNLIQISRPLEAKDILLKVLEKYPNSINALSYIAIIYFAEEDNKKTQETYLKLISLDPNNAVFHSNLGFLYLNQNEYTKAKICFEKAINADKNYKTAYINLAQVYINEKDIENATSVLNKYLLIDNNDKHVINILKRIAQ